MVHYFSRHYDEAIDQSRETLELSPVTGPVHQSLAYAYAQKCMWKEAKEEIEKASNWPTMTFEAKHRSEYSARWQESWLKLEEFVTN